MNYAKVGNRNSTEAANMADDLSAGNNGRDLCILASTWACRSMGGLRLRRRALEVTGSGNNVLLIGDGAGRELETVPPVNCLLVVRIGPECMERIVGADRNIAVITKETTAEAIAAVNRLCRNYLGRARAQVRHGIV